MNNPLKVSVITVTYNAEKTLERTIKSVIRQNYPNHEYIIVDGNSTDATLDIVNKYKNHINIVISEPDKGIYDAMNKGVEVSSGDLVGLLNADDWYEDDALKKVSEFYDNETDLLYGKINYHFPNGEKIVGHSNFKEYFSLWKEPGPPHRGFFISKRYYRKHKYDISYSISADYKFLFEAYSNNAIVAFIDEILVNSSPGGTSSAIGKPPIKGYKTKIEIANQEYRARKEAGYPLKLNIARRLVDHFYDLGSLLKNTTNYYLK